MAEGTMQSLDQLSDAQAGRRRPRLRNTSRSSTSRAAPTRPASARTRSPASGSSRAPARSRSTPARIEVYFARPVLRMLIQQPLVATNRNGQYDVICTVSGGGLSGQAGAVRHGLSKALMAYEPDLRGALKKGGFLTRDSRVVERKKYGRPRPAAASSSRSAKRVGQADVSSGWPYRPSAFFVRIDKRKGPARNRPHVEDALDRLSSARPPGRRS